MCLQFGLNLLPLSHSSERCTDKCTGTSTCIPEGKDKPGPWSCTGKGYQSFYIFNKVDLFLLLPRKLVLRCTQIITYCGTVNYYKCHRIQAAPSLGQIFECFADVYGLLQNFCQVTHTTQHLLKDFGTW